MYYKINFAEVTLAQRQNLVTGGKVHHTFNEYDTIDYVEEIHYGKDTVTAKNHHFSYTFMVPGNLRIIPMNSPLEVKSLVLSVRQGSESVPFKFANSKNDAGAYLHEEFPAACLGYELLPSGELSCTLEGDDGRTVLFTAEDARHVTITQTTTFE